MKVFLNKHQRKIRIHPAPKKDIKGGLVCYMKESYERELHEVPIAETDVIAGQALYTVDKRMRGKIIEAKIVDTEIK